jgi:hypothetical protein
MGAGDPAALPASAGAAARFSGGPPSAGGLHGAAAAAGAPASGARATRCRVYPVLENELLSQDVHRLWIEAPHVARKRKPGQFVIIRVGEEGERIPLTIADVDTARGAIALIVQGVGKSTRELNLVPAGGTVLDVAGPPRAPHPHRARRPRLLCGRRHRRCRGLSHRLRRESQRRARDGHPRRAHQGSRPARTRDACGRRRVPRHHRRWVGWREGPGDRRLVGDHRRRCAHRRSGRRRPPCR